MERPLSGLPERCRMLVRSMGRTAPVATAVVTACTLSCAEPRLCRSTTPGLLAGSDCRALVIPLTTIHTLYRDNTQAAPDIEFTDSFLIAAANTFLRFEVTRLCEVLPADTSVAARLRDSGEQLAEHIRSAAESSGVRLVVVAHACTAGTRVYQPEGWRHNTGPGYARPVESTGFARLHVRVFGRDGTLLYECVGRASVGKPLLYGLFNFKRRKERRDEELRKDVVKAARRLYAPPIVRALGKAARNALPYR